MATGHTDARIRKLHARGMSPEQIARKIGRPGDVARVIRVLLPMREPVLCALCGADVSGLGHAADHACEPPQEPPRGMRPGHTCCGDVGCDWCGDVHACGTCNKTCGSAS